jgi:hypothetical protein
LQSWLPLRTRPWLPLAWIALLVPVNLHALLLRIVAVLG